MEQELTQCFTAIQSGSEAAGVGVDGDVGGGGVQQRVSDNDRVDDALAGDGVEHRCGHISWRQCHYLQVERTVMTQLVPPWYVLLLFFFLLLLTHAAYPFAVLHNALDVSHDLKATEQAALW